MVNEFINKLSGTVLRIWRVCTQCTVNSKLKRDMVSIAIQTDIMKSSDEETHGEFIIVKKEGPMHTPRL